MIVNSLEYNTERDDLIIPEYGRHIQKMIQYAKTRKTKEARSKLAKAIIAVMANMQPNHLKEAADFQNKLWDQLFIMSGFQLDVDMPYSKPTKELLEKRPEPMGYPQNFPKYRFYGNNIKTMIDVVCMREEGSLKKALVYNIANYMKKCFLIWNKDTVEDSVIYEHLFELSEGRIDLRDTNGRLLDAAVLVRTKFKPMGNRKNGYHKKNNTNYNRQKKYF